jgi:hypothetical protein
LPDATSAAQLGLGNDQNMLGVQMKTLMLQEAPS